MSEAFSNQTLIERLGKLNNSQLSIQGLSNWCLLHRKKAKQIVETWDQVFGISSKEKRIPLLYVANDILQNSRRKGNEFVNEFWKVLPGCLRSVHENGEDQGKKVVTRLVDIWDERKVFGSRGQGLKDEILGSAAPPASDNGKNSNPVKVVKKDANSVRVKLAVGGMPEKIVSAYQTVLDEHFNEDTALNKCKVTTEILDNMKKDVEDASAQGNQQGPQIISDLLEHEAVLKQCVEQLEGIKSSRASLIVQLKEALQDQESKLELIDSQLQIAQDEIDYVNMMRQKLGFVSNVNGVGSSSMPPNAKLALEMTVAEQNPSQHQQGQPLTSFASTVASAEEEHKKAAAAVAAKLAASSSSAQVLSSILSSLVAEEAASKNSGLNAGVLSSNSPMFPAEKRPKLEKPMSLPDMGSNTPYFGQIQQQQQQSAPHSLSQSSTANVQALSLNNQGSTPFTPPPPPLPPLPPPPGQQYAQTMGMVPFGYMGNMLPPPLPSHASLGLARPGNAPLPPPPTPLPQQQQLLPQQLQTSMGIYPSGLGFFGQLQSSPSAQRQ